MASRERSTAPKERTILVHVTGDRIGDALIKWPVIVALKRALPDHHLVWMAGLRDSVFNGALAPLARGVIDTTIQRGEIGVRWRELWRAPPVDRLDIVLATESKLRNAILLKRLSPEIFISPALGFALSDRRPPAGTPYPKSIFAQMRLLASLAAGRELDISTHIDVGKDNRQLASRLLPAGPVYVGFAPGSAGRRKRWPLARYLELAECQIDRQRTPVFFLGPEERELYATIERAIPAAICPEQAPTAAARGPLLSIALAERLAVAVANDSGGGHLLAAGGKPLISLFAHTDPEKFKPPYGKRIAICAREYGGTDIGLIPVSRVAAAIESELNIV